MKKETIVLTISVLFALACASLFFSYILAQIPQTEATAISKRESVTLPVGQKVGMMETARRYLATIYEEYGTDMYGVVLCL